jgi:hypothetical protein
MFLIVRRARKQLVGQTDVTDDDAIARAMELSLCHANLRIYVDGWIEGCAVRCPASGSGGLTAFSAVKAQRMTTLSRAQHEDFSWT